MPRNIVLALIGAVLLGFFTTPNGADSVAAAAQNANAATQQHRLAATAREAIGTGCQTQSSRYPWGKQPLRTWTPNNVQPGAGSIGNPGIAEGSPFAARLITAHGRDTTISRELVTLEREDGCRRTYPSASFDTTDRSIITTQRAQHPPIADPDTYALYPDPAFVTREHLDEGSAKVVQTQHFAIWYGLNTSAFSYKWQADRGIEWNRGIADLGRWMEQTWSESRDIAEAPMPYEGSTDKRKINIFLCGTGLPFFSDTGDCGASAGSLSIFVSAVYILDGSSTMVHEFGHTLQAFTGGFTGSLPGVGNIWETHANWLASTLVPDFNIWYFQNLENGPTWHTNYYGAFPLLQQLFQRDATRSFVWRAWTENLRNADGLSEEEFLETIVRLGKAEGIYPRGYRSFADEVGWYGARLAAADFEQGKIFADITTSEQEGSRYIGLNATDFESTYASSASRPLWQFGTHLVPLRLDPGSSAVRVSLTGKQKANTAEWRYALVGVSADGTPSYSSLGADTPTTTGDVLELKLNNAEQVFLAVSATPNQYERLGDHDQPDPSPTTFPYTVDLDGAQPALPGSGVCLGPNTSNDAANLNWNTNGHFPYDQQCASTGPSVAVTADPHDTEVRAGSSATFTAASDGHPGATTQWQVLEPASTRWAPIAGSPTSVSLPSTRPSGTLVRLLVRGADGALVISRSAKLTVIAEAKVLTRTSLTVDRPTQTYATTTPLTLNARVKSSDKTSPQGTVTFTIGSFTSAPITLKGGVARLPLPNTTSVGKHSVTAKFIPARSGPAPSASQPIMVTVSKAASKVTGKTAPSATKGTKITITAYVTVPGLTAPTGQLSVLSAGNTIARTTLTRDNKGKVTLPLTGFSKAGAYTFTVRYSGNQNVAPSGSSLLRVVVR